MQNGLETSLKFKDIHLASIYGTVILRHRYYIVLNNIFIPIYGQNTFSPKNYD